MSLDSIDSIDTLDAFYEFGLTDDTDPSSEWNGRLIQLSKEAQNHPLNQAIAEFMFFLQAADEEVAKEFQCEVWQIFLEKEEEIDQENIKVFQSGRVEASLLAKLSSSPSQNAILIGEMGKKRKKKKKKSLGEKFFNMVAGPVLHIASPSSKKEKETEAQQPMSTESKTTEKNDDGLLDKCLKKVAKIAGKVDKAVKKTVRDTGTGASRGAEMIGNAVDEASLKLMNAGCKASHKANDFAEEVKEFVKEHPLETVVIVAVVVALAVTVGTAGAAAGLGLPAAAASRGGGKRKEDDDGQETPPAGDSGKRQYNLTPDEYFNNVTSISVDDQPNPGLMIDSSSHPPSIALTKTEHPSSSQFTSIGHDIAVTHTNSWQPENIPSISSKGSAFPYETPSLSTGKNNGQTPPCNAQPPYAPPPASTLPAPSIGTFQNNPPPRGGSSAQGKEYPTICIDPDAGISSVYVTSTKENGMAGPGVNTVTNPIAFAWGMLKGLPQGSAEGIENIIPNTIDAIEFVSRGAWNFLNDPVQTSSDIYSGVRDCITFLRDRPWEEILGATVPEVKELTEQWGQLSDVERGEKSSYILTKYGAEVFAPSAVAKGLSSYQTLYRSTRLMELGNRAIALEKASDFVALSELFSQDSMAVGNQLRATMSASKMQSILQNGGIGAELKLSASEIAAMDEIAQTARTTRMALAEYVNGKGTHFSQTTTVASHNLTEIENAAKSLAEYGRAGPAADRIQFEALKTEYRKVMEKPCVTDPDLAKSMNKLWRPDAEIGNGSTAAAVRYELETGLSVKGKDHIQKAQNELAALEKWLRTHPTASLADRAAAENVILDLKNALDIE